MADFVWAITTITKSGSNWVTQGQPTVLDVWFGTSPPPNPGDYDIVIIDTSGNGLVDASEMRTALTNTPWPAGGTSQGFLGSDFVTIGGENTAAVAYVPAGQNGGINSQTTAYMITLAPQPAGTIVSDADFKGGVGNFSPFFPGKLSDICFTAGTAIATPDGLRAVEALAIGDLVATLSGNKPIRWIGERSVTALELFEQPNRRPVRISAGALGGGMPEADLTVSRQHRIVLRSALVQKLYGRAEVLVPAHVLVGHAGVTLEAPATGVRYFHLLLDRHEIVLANGAQTETLYVGPQALKALDPAARAEVLDLVPEIAHGAHPPSRHLILSNTEARRLVAEHDAAGLALWSEVAPRDASDTERAAGRPVA